MEDNEKLNLTESQKTIQIVTLESKTKSLRNRAVPIKRDAWLVLFNELKEYFHFYLLEIDPEYRYFFSTSMVADRFFFFISFRL